MWWGDRGSRKQPEFFIPYIDDPIRAEEVWQAVASFARSQGWDVGDERVFRLEYTHDTKEMEAQVGEPHAYGR